jgi:hypothetical protein
MMDAQQQGAMSQADNTLVQVAETVVDSAPAEELSPTGNAVVENSEAGAATPVAATTLEITKLIATK